MRRQRSIFDIFPETVDLNQGPDFNSRGMNEPDECNSRISPTERRLLSNDLSGELNFSCVNANDHHNSQSFRSWDVGESSSRANPQGQEANDSLKLERNWSSSFDTHDSRFRERQFDSSNTQLQISGSNPIAMDVDLNVGYGGSSSSSDGVIETSDSSFGNLGLSCKRKALEGTSSGENFGSGSSSCFPEMESIPWHNGSSSVSASSSMVNSQEQMNTITGVPESSRRYYGMRDSNPFNISSSSTGNLGSCSNSSSHGEHLDQTSRGPISRSTNSSHLSNIPPPLMNVPGISRNLLPFPWSSSSSGVPRENGSEANFRSTLRNNEQDRYFVSSNQTRNLVQDPTNWSLASGRSSFNGGNRPSSSRNDSIWMPHLNSTTESQQRPSELPPWTLFPSSETESGGHRGHFRPFPLGSSSTSDENVLSSGVNSHGRHHQPFLRPPSLMEVPGDEWQPFTADIEGRHRLVSEMRQILNALRRGESLRPEDYMLFDPFINGVAELHDRHRDMRLDVDNMSYEELLALEERIGDVKTGLSEEVILKSMKQRKHISFMAISTPHLEPCCICREEYANGDDLGSLDCGHDFHTDCIKQWLAQKNICPICKMTGLST